MVVYVMLDYEQQGVMGTCQIERYFKKGTAGLKPNQKVDLLVWDVTKLGTKVVIDNAYNGLLYHNEVFEPIKVGDRRKGFIKKIRDDGLVDAALQPQGFRPAENRAENIVLQALKDAGGFLPLHDKSSPHKIHDVLGVSKKQFKRTIGVLYKKRLITIKDNGIESR